MKKYESKKEKKTNILCRVSRSPQIVENFFFTCNFKLCEYNLLDYKNIYNFRLACSLRQKPKTIKVKNAYFGTKIKFIDCRPKSNRSILDLN